MNKIKQYFKVVVVTCIVAIFSKVQAQELNKVVLPEKVSHAEPLYMDLARDLGARKGEKEINIGSEFKDKNSYSEYLFLAEYEWAPVNRLGLEAEADFSFYNSSGNVAEAPENKLESVKFSAQYSFWVSKYYAATTAIGYTQSFELTTFKEYGNQNLFTGTIYAPYFVAAKRLGKNLHTLLFFSPLIEQEFGEKILKTNWLLNASIHYVFPRSKHFIGLECNQEWEKGTFNLVAHPQFKMKVNKQLAIGVVAGIPVTSKGEKVNSFLRIIYEL